MGVLDPVGFALVWWQWRHILSLNLFQNVDVTSLCGF